MCKNTIEKSDDHRIIIDNVKDGEILNYSLVICKGHIENLNNTNCKSSTSTDLVLKVTHNEITNKININPKTSKFRFIVDLKLAINIININFCCTSTNITVEFKRRNTNLCVVPLYIICKGHNGTFQGPETEPNNPESACKRIITGCKLIQSVFAEKLHECGLGRKSFQLDYSLCVTFHSQLHFEETHKMSQLEMWYYFAREIMSSDIGSCNRKYLAFLSSTNYNGSKYSEDMKDYTEILKLTQGYVAFGGEGLALLSTACLYTWPQSILEIEDRFRDESKVDRTKFMDDSNYRGTLGGCFATTLGAALHELSHSFDLGHSESGIMGRGFDDIQNTFLSNNCDTNQSIRVNFSKTSHIANNYKRSGEIYWNENCLLFLNFHRWFNDFDTRKCILQYHPETKILKSTAGLRVVEIRRKCDEIVLQHWIFTDKVLKYSYQINELKNFKDVLLVVEDNQGNILKENI